MYRYCLLLLLLLFMLLLLLLLLQGFFRPRVPVDNLEGFTVGVSYFGDMDLVNPTVVSPDAGGVYR
jgi:quinol-cytochrome oxidoreductase complex cytochrome b subunit